MLKRSLEEYQTWVGQHARVETVIHFYSRYLNWAASHDLEYFVYDMLPEKTDTFLIRLFDRHNRNGKILAAIRSENCGGDFICDATSLILIKTTYLEDDLFLI